MNRQPDGPIDTCRQWQTDRQIERWTDRHSRAVSVYVLLWLTDIFIYRPVDSISFIHINPKINPVNVSMGYKSDNNVEIPVKLLCSVVVTLCSISVK